LKTDLYARCAPVNPGRGGYFVLHMLQRMRLFSAGRVMFVTERQTEEMYNDHTWARIYMVFHKWVRDLEKIYNAFAEWGIYT